MSAAPPPCGGWGGAVSAPALYARWLGQGRGIQPGYGSRRLGRQSCTSERLPARTTVASTG